MSSICPKRRGDGGDERAGAIVFIGVGEAAQAFLAGFRNEPGFAASVATCDIKTDSPDPAVRAPEARRLRAGEVGRRLERP